MAKKGEMKRLALSGLIVACVTSAAGAAPPPAPPAYVYEAGQLLAASPAPSDVERLRTLFSNDVQVFENGESVAEGRQAWLRLAETKIIHAQRRVIGHVEASAGYSKGGGDLLVVDEVDIVDRRGLPTTFLADPRLQTRAFLYQFGSDGLIRTVRITEAAGFWEQAR